MCVCVCGVCVCVWCVCVCVVGRGWVHYSFHNIFIHVINKFTCYTGYVTSLVVVAAAAITFLRGASIWGDLAMEDDMT